MLLLLIFLLTNFNIAEMLSEHDMSILRAYTFKVDEHVTNEAFAKISSLTFPKEPVPPVKVCKAHLQALSGIKSVPYDCCSNPCCSFAGEYKNELKCPYCRKD